YGNEWVTEIYEAHQNSKILSRIKDGKPLTTIAIQSVDRSGNESDYEAKIVMSFESLLQNYIHTKSIKMSLKAVLFDMDGVIVDTEPLHRKAYFKMFEEFEIDVSTELYASFAGATTRRVCRTLIENFNLKTSMEEMFTSKRKHFK